MRLNVNLQQPRPQANVQDVMMLGRPGRPIAMQRFVASQLRRGMGDHYHNYPGGRTGGAITLRGLGAQTPIAPNGTCPGMTVMGPNGCYCPQGIDNGYGACDAPICPQGQEFSPATGGCIPIPGISPVCPAGTILQGTSCFDPAAGRVTSQMKSPIVYTTNNPLGIQLPSNITTQDQYIAWLGTQGAGNLNSASNGTAVLSRGSGSGTQGGGSVIQCVAGQVPDASGTFCKLPDSGTNVNTANTTGTSGNATGNLINGQPAAGSNAGPDAGGTPTPINYTPYLLAAAAVVALMMMMSK